MLPWQQGGWGCTRSRKGTQLGQVTPTTDQTDTWYHESQHVTRVKAGWRTLFGNWLGIIWLFFICITYFISIFVNFLFSIIYSLILFQLWSCFYLKAWVYLLARFQFSPPSHHLGERVAVLELSCWLELSHDRCVGKLLVCFLMLLWCSFALPHLAVSGLLMCRMEFFCLLL